MQHQLVIDDLHACVDGQEILKGLSLTIRPGEIHAMMGPNGSGKSTLANTLMGHPSYEITGGTVTFSGQDLAELEAHERAKLGLFLAFQYPTAIPGVTMANFLRLAVSSVRDDGTSESATTPLIPMRDFRRELKEKMKKLGIDESFARRYLNDGFSGGEKKNGRKFCNWQCWNPK